MMSAHARGKASLAFSRSLEHVPEAQRDRCLPCHAPLRASAERIATEGVTCDACHTAVSAAPAPGGVILRPELATKFGPYRDAKDHHFHRVAFSEFVAGSELCIACHSDREPGPVAVLTSVEEWRASPHKDKSCPSCHMPTARARAAKGGRERTVYHHGFGADRARALAGAIKVKTSAKRTGRTSQLAVSVTNASAGHALPTDLPERRLRLEVEAMTRSGETALHAERVFGRQLVDGAGQPAPFFLAVREASDDRLAAGKTRLERFDLPAESTRARVRLRYERWDPALDRYYGPAPRIVVFEREVSLR